jgi:RHS repeat-associated protein
VSYTYANGFLTAVPSYATSISYHVNTMVNRIAHANAVNVDHTIDPDDMRRPRQIALSNANGSWTYGNYAYDGAGNIKGIGSDTYLYDAVSRLASGSFATASCGAKSQTAAYNPFGFMTSTTTTDWGTQGFTEAAGGLYNRISGVGYDAAGNTTSWGTYSYTWNRLNQMLTATSGANHTFFYTADGERISDRVGSTRTLTIRDLSNKVLRIYAYNGSAWSWTKDYVYRDGQLLATVEPPFASQVTKHVHLDHLGTPRRITDSARNIIATHDYYPFGMEACGTADSERMKLTGHERDLQGTASQTDDLDYMHARYHNPNVARFLSVDPGRDNNPKVPQSWNLYAYVRNNPVNAIDPDGRLMKITDARAMALFLWTLPKEVRQQVRAAQLKNGLVDKAKINAIKNDSKNFLAFRDVVNNSQLVQVSSARVVTYPDQAGRREETELLSGAGLTLTPLARTNAYDDSTTGFSRSGNVEVYVYRAPGLPNVEDARILAHELYGHARLYVLSQPFMHDQIPGENDFGEFEVEVQP